MKKIIETAKKSSVASRVIAVLLVVVICVTSIWHGMADKASNVNAAEGGATEEKQYIDYIIDRMIGGLQENFTIVEVVPHESMGEFRYYIGEDDVEEGLESNTTLMNWYFQSKGNAVKDIWYDMGSDFSNFGYSFRFNSTTNKYEVESPMRFVNFVLPEYKEYFVENIDLITVAGNDLTPEILDKADLLVLSTGIHDESTIDCYNSYTDPTVTDLNSAAAWEFNIWSGTVNADGTSTDMTRVTNKSNFSYNTFEQIDDNGTTKYVSRDISWEMVEKLWQYTIKGKKVKLSDGDEVILKVPVIMDNKGFQSLNQEGNMYKYQIVYRALTEAQYDTLLPYISSVDNASNSYINNENIISAELDVDKVFPVGAELTWYIPGKTQVMETFYKIFGNPYDQNSGVSQDAYQDYQAPHSDILRDWYWVYNGDSCLIPSNKDKTYKTDSVGSILGFGDRVGTSCTVIDVMRYLLGAKDAPVIDYNNPVIGKRQVKILEIQPTAGTNVFKYDTYDEVKALAQKMLLAVDGKDADGNQIFDALTEDNYNDPKAKTCIYVECISSSGFNGINDDIIADYDAIFLGDNDELLLKGSNDKPIYNDTALNGYIYLAFGDLIKCKTGISVYYPEDYTSADLVNVNGYTKVTDTLWNDRGVVSPWVHPKLDADGNVVRDVNGDIVYEGIPWRTRNDTYKKVYKLDTKLWNPLLYNSTSMTLGHYYVLADATSEALNASSQSAMLSDKTGLVRLSGNDITQLKCNQLKEFVDSGKLLVLGEELYNYTNASKTIYPTSNMAEIAQYVIDKDGNRIKESRIGAMLLYLSNENPKILNLKTPTPVKYDANGIVTEFNEAKVLEDGTSLKATDLPFSFTIDGKPNTNYQIRVYGDKNNDGVYDKSGTDTDDKNERYFNNSETITDANGIADVIITVELPEEYNGLMSYRLEVTELDAAGNERPYRAGITGYTAIKGAELKSIHVLQILPVPYRDSRDSKYVDKGINLNMETDANFNTLIDDAESVIGYDIDVHAVYTEEYENWFNPSKGGMAYNASDSDTDRLYNYDMVVIGFGDLYCSDDISNDNGALDCLNDFIAKGKAVLFTHDTIGYSNTVNGMYNNGGTLDKHKTNTWATSLSRMFRVTVGMDRYRITEAESLTASEFNNVPYYKDGSPVLYGLQGVTNMLAYRHSVATQAANDKVDYEVAVPDSGKYLLYPYTTGSISDYTSLMETTKVTKLNDGQVTMFPYAISDTLTVAETHSQWYQLDMEDPEIVVWYTLAGDGNGTTAEYSKYGYEDAAAATKASKTLDQYYIDNDKDAGNNYYIYSKKNITYSGAGHSSMDSPEELKLFVNTVVKAITAGNSTPEVKVKESSLAADGFNNVYVTPYSGDYSFKFVGTDADLLPRVGLFKTAKITLTNVDTDSDGDVDDDDRVTWDLGNTLLCDKVMTVEIKEGGSGEFDDYAAEISDLIDTVSGAQFEIVITDMYNAEGRAKVKLVKRDLFNMD